MCARALEEGSLSSLFTLSLFTLSLSTPLLSLLFLLFLLLLLRIKDNKDVSTIMFGTPDVCPFAQ